VRLPGAGPSHLELTPQGVPAADEALRMTVVFVVAAVPGEQDVKAAEALDAQGHVITRCGSTGGCEDVRTEPLGRSADGGSEFDARTGRPQRTRGRGSRAHLSKR
jgi:hypothetical protein